MCGTLDLFKAYLDAKQREFGTAQERIAAAERTHLSLSSMKSNFVEIGYGESALIKYPDKRFVLAKAIDYDLLISIYDVNSFSLFALRATRQIDMRKTLYEFLKKLRNPNLEIRAIGMQNLKEGYGNDLLINIEQAYTVLKPKAKLVEVDLFGNETRHIAIDAKTGASVDVLLYDRFYKPGELNTQTSLEQFKNITAQAKA